MKRFFKDVLTPRNILGVYVATAIIKHAEGLWARLVPAPFNRLAFARSDLRVVAQAFGLMNGSTNTHTGH